MASIQVIQFSLLQLLFNNIINYYNFPNSNKIKMLKLSLSVDPYLALKHKYYSSEVCSPLHILCILQLGFPFSQLLDLARGTSAECHKYFVPRSAVEAALRTCENYYRYTLALFEEVFDYDVALHCKCSGTYHEESSVDKILATLPQEPLDAFLGTFLILYRLLFCNNSFLVFSTGHCVLVAKTCFKANVNSERQMRMNLARCINVQLRTVRSLTGLGPSPAEFEEYKLAMRRGLKRKLPL